MANPGHLKAAAYGSLVLAFGHALSSRKFMRLRRFQELPSIAYVCSTVGWFQGSGYLVLTALLNLQWSLNPQALDEPLNRAIAGLLTLIAWGSSVSYLRGGVISSGLITAAAGAFQAWAAFRG
ncbi:hypothetical protein BDV35DRAFT_39634 [Aspergillus flavus]|uniref:Uncharacterized protein n=2 Tax=Aspergillus subgen. Circumdati TaxID=2720871 RepID=A0A5N6J4Q5_9EURO|nr:hypothetical protein BDV35DRAFT_39634 [Aspergillus flavus]KAB8272653.1 hypothetical protein BDV30DRAFT_211752 [Aspergillus minisclerotigenes]KAF7617134.1 hypothetical protein AFLA_005180 [Aspergillus flavus NRRL3357]KOC14840.1 hypothetical protein AFLA70_423g001051 [Aspergillus flavus AF70]